MNTQRIVDLFKAGKTITQISELTNYEPFAILFELTKAGHWSKYCSDCVIKRCYDCRGLAEFGKPISIQDQINTLAQLPTRRQHEQA